MGKSLLFGCLMPLVSFSQGVTQSSGARAVGMANCSVAIADVWAVNYNQAAMSELEVSRIALSYAKPFFLRDINIMNIAVTRPVGAGALGFSFGYLALDSYFEATPRIAYAHPFGPSLSVGIGLNVDVARMQESGKNILHPNGALGILAKPSQDIRIGFHLSNIHSIWNNQHITTKALISKLGLAYEVSDQLLVAGEFSKQLDHPESIRIGLEYLPAKELAIRIGVLNAPFRQSFGIGYTSRNLSMDLGCIYMFSVGASTVMGLEFLLQ